MKIPYRWLALLSVTCLPNPAVGDDLPLSLARDGKTDYVIIQGADAAPSEANAARELAAVLNEITGCQFAVKNEDSKAPVPAQAIFVGPGVLAKSEFESVPWAELGDEEIVLKTKDQRLLIAGGRPRGTLYAVSRFLQDACGVRWWTPWAARIPKQPSLAVPRQDTQAKPAFESRDPYWFPAFNREWAVRNFSNSQAAHIPEAWGGAITYKGFVHTFYPLVPPSEHFAAHPEWFSLVKGQRTHDRAQLCLTNPQLRDFLVERAREWLRESPQARIISISQNDWYGACECDACKALDDAEGSQSGTMLAAVNYVAEKLEKEFPQVAFDTLAYQYTRKPPKTLRPRPNVIVRLCSIECNFREPLDHSSNATFADDIRGWSRICQRLYVWDYTTDFAHYLQPHPNWFVLGPNLRFFQQHHVRGVFEQGAYQSYGSEFAELRSWVLAQLLWNPFQDDRALIREFVHGYYGDAAAPYVLKYLDLMHTASAGWNLTCFSRTETPFHQFATLNAAEDLWRQAAKAAEVIPDHLLRVEMARLPVRYVFLSRWDDLRKEGTSSDQPWPLAESRAEVADAWARLAGGTEGSPWTKVTHLNERGLAVDQFLAAQRNAIPPSTSAKPR